MRDRQRSDDPRSNMMRRRLDRYQKLLRLETDERLLEIVDGLVNQLLQRHEKRPRPGGPERQSASRRRSAPPALPDESGC